MVYTIKNKNLTLKVNSFGAEMVSLKKNNIEFIWQADENYWKRYTPVLFPCVGKNKDDKMLINGKYYPMKQHGFARDTEFKLFKKTSSSLTFVLSWKANDVYPFSFDFFASFTLKNDSVYCGWKVIQTKDLSKPMFFGIGAHPGFNVPFSKKSSFNDYQIEMFTSLKNLVRYNMVNSYIDHKHPLKQSKKITLDRNLWSNGAFIVEAKKIKKVVLSSKKEKNKLEITFNNMNYLGLWTPYPKEAPFFCIEPWVTSSDELDFNGELKTKRFIINLAKCKKHTYENGYTISIK